MRIKENLSAANNNHAPFVERLSHTLFLSFAAESVVVTVYSDGEDDESEEVSRNKNVANVRRQIGIGCRSLRKGEREFGRIDQKNCKDDRVGSR